MSEKTERHSNDLVFIEPHWGSIGRRHWDASIGMHPDRNHLIGMPLNLFRHLLGMDKQPE